MKKKITYILEYCILKLLIFIFSFLSHNRASHLGGKILRIFMPLTKLHKIACNNMQKVFPDKSFEQIDVLAKDMWYNFGRSCAEFPYNYSMTRAEYNEKLIIKNPENLDFLKDGGILFSAHFGNWEIVPRLLFEKNMPISVFYRKSENPLLEKMIQKFRNGSHVNFIAKGREGNRALLKAIQEKHVIVILVDKRSRDGIIMPFLGHDAYIATGISKLILKYSLPVISCRVTRDNNKLIASFYPKLKVNITSDYRKDVYNLTKQVKNQIEEWILENPELWLWFFNKWKL